MQTVNMWPIPLIILFSGIILLPIISIFQNKIYPYDYGIAIVFTIPGIILLNRFEMFLCEPFCKKEPENQPKNRHMLSTNEDEDFGFIKGSYNYAAFHFFCICAICFLA